MENQNHDDGSHPAGNAPAPTIDLEILGDSTEPPKRGRPKGSKNKILSPRGDKVSEENRQRYVQIVNAIHEDIHVAENALYRLADNLEIIQREGLFYGGGYKTFSEFCKAEIGCRSQGYRLLDARAVIQNLLEAGFSEDELPEKERLCRAIHKLSPIDQGKVWKLVLKYKAESGKEPTGQDMDRAMAALDDEKDSTRDPNPNKARDEEQSAKLIADWGSAAKKFKVGLSIESLNGPTRLRLAAILSEVQATITRLMATLNHRDQQEQEGR